jgi:hypothetical protein
MQQRQGGFRVFSWALYKREVLFPSAASALLIIAACGGKSNPAVSPTPVPLTWTFGGSAGDLVPTSVSTPAPVTLAAYNAVAATLQFNAANTASVTISVADARNNGDISPNTLPVDNATSGTTPFLYLSFYNGTSMPATFGSVTPSIQLTDTAGFGTASACELDAYTNNTWSSSGAAGAISGTGVTINSAVIANNGTFQFLPGQTIMAIACK